MLQWRRRAPGNPVVVSPSFAEEVRSLALRSAEAARNSADLIEGSVKKAEDGVAINQEVLGKLNRSMSRYKK